MKKADYVRLFAWIVSLIATLGSLYFSEIRGFIPCELCWYQRILMYPLVVILGIGFYKKDKLLPLYVLPFSIVGMAVGLLHYLHQKTDFFREAIQCTQGVPCSGQYINWLGFITIPFLSMTAFFLLTISIIILIYTEKKADHE